MAYAERYYGEFYYDHDSNNDLYRVSIFEDGFADSATELILSDNPVVINVRGQRDTADSIIMGSEIEVSFIAENGQFFYLLDEDGVPITTESGGTLETEDSTSLAGTIRDYDDILVSEQKEFLIKLIKDPNGSPVTEWVGYVEPSNCTRELTKYKYIYTISAVDGLAMLKEYKYSSNGQTNGSPYYGYEDGITIIKTAIEKMATVSDMQLSFKIQLGTYSDQMADDECAFEENEFIQDNFFTVTDGGYEFDNCYEVIEKILKPFNCILRQSGGYYWIQNICEQNSYAFTIASTSSFETWFISSSTRDASDLTIDANDYQFFSPGSVYKVDSLSHIKSTLYNREYGVEFVTNGGFDSNIVGWTNGEAQAPVTQNGWSLSYYDYPGLGGTLEADVGPGAAYYSFNQTITINDVSGTAPLVSVRWDGELTSESRSGGPSAIPLVRARLFDATYINGTIGQQPFISVGGFYSFSDSFDVASFSSTSIEVEIEVQIQDATTTAAEFHFDNISVIQFTTEEPRDWLFNTNRTSVDFNKEIDSDTILYFGDSQETQSDSCSIKDTGGTLTSTWTRCGKTEDVEIVKLYNQNIANDYAIHKDYIRTTIYDSSNLILPISFPKYDFKTYRILGYTKNYREASVDVDMIEVLNEDVNTASFKWKLDTQYGEDQ